MPPYASVIIPTHNRAATLDVALASVQSQTVRDIEILLVCDGATEDVLHMSRAIASNDARVKVLEFEKGPGAGGSNRDRAIREHAGSDRIFYTDDDDLWLASHIETIGPHLDQCEVVDTLPVSASLCGRLALAPVNSGNNLTRRLLVEDRLKLMYDTHLAHRRSTYLRFGAPWTQSEGGDIVRRLFATFASDASLQWRTLPIATAVSLHGGARAAATPSERRAEILNWQRKLHHFTPHALTADTSPAWQLFSCLNALPPAHEDDLESYLSRLGLALPASVGDGDLVIPIAVDTADELATVFALHRREPVAPDQLQAVAPLLLDTVKHAIASWAYLRRALSHLSFPDARRFVTSMSKNSARFAELVSIYGVYQNFWAKRFDEAWQLAESLLEEVRFVPHEIELVAGDVLIELGQIEFGLALIRQAASRTHRGSAIQLRLVQACLKIGAFQEALDALEEAETRIGNLKQTARLRSQLEEAMSADARLAPPT